MMENLPHFIQVILYWFGILIALNIGVAFGAWWTSRRGYMDADKHAESFDGQNRVISFDDYRRRIHRIRPL